MCVKDTLRTRDLSLQVLPRVGSALVVGGDLPSFPRSTDVSVGVLLTLDRRVGGN